MPDSAAAIRSIESGGNYGILGPMTHGGHRAYGAYQVMDYNIAPWTKEVLGVELSPQQFLSSPQAQDAVFQAKFGQYVQKYGNPQDAASAWFTGRPLAQGGNASDVTGTTGNQYVARFNRALGGELTGTGPQVSSAEATSNQPAPQGQQQAQQPPAQPGGMPAFNWTPQVGSLTQPPQGMQTPQMLPALNMPQMRPQVNYQALRQALANLPAAARGYSFLG